MPYDVSTKKYPIGADVDAAATFLAQRFSDSATTNGGIVASGGATPVTLMPYDPLGNGMSLAYLKAQMDAIMCTVGYQAKVIDTNGPGTSNSTASTSFVNMPSGGSGSFTATIAKSYLLHVDVNSIFATAGGGVIYFQILINGVAVTANTGMTWVTNTINARSNLSFRQAVTFAVGSNSIQFQWKTNGGTANWDSTSALLVHVSG